MALRPSEQFSRARERGAVTVGTSLGLVEKWNIRRGKFGPALSPCEQGEEIRA